jgi:hypothetical protein
VFILDPPLPPSLSVHGARPCVSFLTTPENQPPAAFSACACHHRTESESLYSYSYRGVTTLACTPQPPRLSLFFWRYQLLPLLLCNATLTNSVRQRMCHPTPRFTDVAAVRPSRTRMRRKYATPARSGRPHHTARGSTVPKTVLGAALPAGTRRFVSYRTRKPSVPLLPFSAWCLPPSLGVALQLQGIKTLACTPQPPRLSSSFFSLALTSRNGIFSRLRCGTMLKQSALLCLCSRSCYPTRTRHERGPRAAAACFVQFHGEFSHLLLSVSAACPCSRQTTDPSLMTEK